jgi:nucleotide-binding universal stress UspA family protein
MKILLALDGGLDRPLLGSVARIVLSHAHCSVLIMRKEA